MKISKDILVNSKIKIIDAIKKINIGKIKIIFVISDENKLLGTITDGDIRRGLLRGLNLNSSIETVYNKSPTYCYNFLSNNEILEFSKASNLDQIPIVDKNKVLIDIFIVNKSNKDLKKNNKVILMLGGRGSRLMPLTKNTPKPMLKLDDKPILEHILKKFIKFGYWDFVFSVNYKHEIISNFFQDGKKYGVNIEYIREKEKMGTAGSLALIQNKPKETFFVMNGDILTNLNFENALNFHKEFGSTATMCVQEHLTKIPYGEVLTSDENIVSIKEKPIHRSYINAGIYLLEPNVLNFIPKKFYDMPSLFNKLIKLDKKVTSFPIREDWLDIGVFNDYQRAKIDFLS